MTIIFAKRFYIEFGMGFWRVPGPCQRGRRQSNPPPYRVDCRGLYQCTLTHPFGHVITPCGRTGHWGSSIEPRPDLRRLRRVPAAALAGLRLVAQSGTLFEGNLWVVGGGIAAVLSGRELGPSKIPSQIQSKISLQK